MLLERAVRVDVLACCGEEPLHLLDRVCCRPALGRQLPRATGVRRGWLRQLHGGAAGVPAISDPERRQRRQRGS
eukprot:330205-Prorocentrum_lima.AAC.1